MSDSGPSERVYFEIVDLIRSQRYGEVESTIDNALDVLSEDQAFALTSLMHERMGNAEEAINHIKKALAHKPRDLAYLHTLAKIYISSGQFGVAITILNQIISISEENDDTYLLDDARFKKIFCLSQLRRDAEIPAEKAKILDPENRSLIAGRLYSLDELPD